MTYKQRTCALDHAQALGWGLWHALLGSEMGRRSVTGMRRVPQWPAAARFWYVPVPDFGVWVMSLECHKCELTGVLGFCRHEANPWRHVSVWCLW